MQVSRTQIRQYGGWYFRAHDYIRTRYGADAELFIDLLSATSPRVSVKKNWKAANALLEHWKRTGEIDRSAIPMRTHYPNVERAFRGIPLSGDKVSRFARNLKGDWGCVTIDVWICKHYGVEQKRLTPKRYRELEQKIKRAAAYHGVFPCEYQATIWQLERMCQGFKPTSFLASAADERQMTFKWN